MDKTKQAIKILNTWKQQQSVKHHKIIKILNIMMLLLSGIMFVNGGIGSTEIPDFVKYSKWDIWVWAIILYSLALLQLFTLLRHNCVESYRWSNTVLIISGFTLLIVGCLFGFKYPPSNWQMTWYPFVGFLLSLVGRQLNKVTQAPKGKCYGKTN